MHCNFPFKVWGDEKQAAMESLPEDCLFEILRRLLGKERRACACVSKGWLSILSSIHKSDICNPDLNDAGVSFDEKVEGRSLSRHLEGKKATDVTLLAISVNALIHGGLVKLSIGGSNSSHGVTDFGLSGIARSCPALKSFSLWKVPCVGDKGLSEIAKGCSLLEELDLCHCTSITNEGLQAIAQSCSELKTISIEDCRLIRDQGIASLSSSSSLIKMKLDRLRISDFSLASLAHNGKSIVHLKLSNLKNVSEEGFRILGSAGSLQSLMSLAVTSCLGVTDLSIEAIGKGCANLKQIFLWKCHLVHDQGLVAFSKSAVSLESLHLKEINRITLPGIISALSGCPKLRNLSLVSCGGIKDPASGGGELLLSTPCRSMRYLSVQNCPDFHGAGLKILGKMCPELYRISVSGLYDETNEAVRYKPVRRPRGA